MPRRSKRRKRRDKYREPVRSLTYRERNAIEEQEALRYESACRKIGTSLAGRRKPPDAQIIEKLRRQANELENRRND